MVNGYICLYYIKVQDKSQSTIATVYFHCENQMNRVYLAQNEKSSQQKAICYRHDIIVTRGE
jgi:hypothetical protein